MRYGCWLVVVAPMALGACAGRPVAEDDSAVAMRGSALDINVLANDRDPEGRPLIIARAKGAEKGTLSINADNSVRYTPDAGAQGDDTFSYRVKNNRGRGVWADVRVTIVEPLPGRVLATNTPPPPPPVLDLPTARAESARPVATPAPAATPVVAKSVVFVQGVAVTLFTREDDKDLGEPVQIIVRRGEERLAERTIGAGERWEPETDRTEELPLSRAIPLADAGMLTLEVRKVPAGPGAGGGWTVQVDAIGRLSDERTVSLVPKTLPFRFGGGSSGFRTWPVSVPRE